MESAQLIALTNPQLLIPWQLHLSSLAIVRARVAIEARVGLVVRVLLEGRVAVGWVFNLEIDETLVDHQLLLLQLQLSLLKGREPCYKFFSRLLDRLLALEKGPAQSWSSFERLLQASLRAFGEEA